MAAPRAAATGTPISLRSADRWSGRKGCPARRPGNSRPTACSANSTTVASGRTGQETRLSVQALLLKLGTEEETQLPL